MKENLFSIANRERAKYKKKYQRAKRLNHILAIPYLILLLPLALPFYIYSLKKSRLRRKKHLAYDAVVLRYCEGRDAALSFVANNEKIAPLGLLEIIKSIDCDSDEAWLKNFNSYLQRQGRTTARLRTGSAHRFNRIMFNAETSIEHAVKISVIMPAYNCESTIEPAMLSILNQTWNNLELIVVDDCSSDNTVNLIENLARKDNRIKLIKSDFNAGPYVAKNRALQLAAGDYITGHDADDLALPNRLESQISPILQDSRCEGTIGFMVRLDEQGSFSFPTPEGVNSYDGISRLAYISLMLPKKLLDEKLGYWDTVRFGADSEMLARAKDLLKSRLKKVNSITMLCLDHPQGLTSDINHGIKSPTGPSTTRALYKENWQRWHSNSSPAGRYIPFPHIGADRYFEAPQAMQVSMPTLTTYS